jgi:vitamin B12 transporter
MIPVSQIERIEILRGNASAVYGSGAVGGVINIITKQGAGKPRPDVSISYGSNNSKNAYLGYSGEVGNTKFSISGNTQLTDGFNSINPKSFQDVNQSPNGFRSQSYRISVIQNLGQGLTFGVSSMANDSWTSLDGTSSPIDADYSNRQLKANSAYVKYAVNDRWLSQLTYSESDNKGQTYYNQYTPYDANWNYVGTLRPSFSNSESKDSHKKTSWLNNYDLNANNKILFGYDQQRLLGQSLVSWAGSINTARDISSMYAGHTGSYGSLTTQANLRYDDIQDSESKATWLAGLGYALNQQWKVTTTYSTAFNAPTGGQLADISQGGNVNLKPEKSKSFESGLQYQDKANLAKLVFFKVDYQDLIVPGTVRVSPCPFSNCGRYLVNTSNASNDGLELSWRSHLPLGTLRLSYTRQNPQDNSTGAMLLNRAKEFGAVEYSYPLGAIELGGKLVASGYRYTPDAYSGATKKTGGYSTYSAYMAYRYDKEWTLRFSAENLTDKEYYQIHGYNSAPQMFFLGLRYQPK